MLRRHFMMNQGVDILSPPDNEIWYTSNDGNAVKPYKKVFGSKIVSHTYKNDKGIITFDNPVMYIGDQAFFRCSSLTSITIPNSVTSIGYRAFHSCTSLASINIPNSVTSIGDQAFHSCKLTSITIPNSVTSIGSSVFNNCESLTSITIPNSVTSIGYGAFKGCTSLNSITFEGTIEQWNNVTKDNNWNDGVPTTVVHCTDGDVEI